MSLRHPLFVTAAAALAVGAGLAIHATAQPPAPGQFVSWSTASSPAPASSSSPAASLLPQPSVSPPADGGLIGGLREPLSSMLHGLNSETENVATGEYSLLQELGSALRDHIDQFLQWVTSRH